MVRQALAGFVGTPHCQLVFVVGNHDIELSLPSVEGSIRELLAADDPMAQSRLIFDDARRRIGLLRRPRSCLLYPCERGRSLELGRLQTASANDLSEQGRRNAPFS